MKRISPLLILFAIALAFAACNNEYVRKQAMQVDLAKDSSTKDAEHLVVFGKPSFKADTIGFLEQGEVLKEYATGGEHNEWISVVLPDGKTG